MRVEEQEVFIFRYLSFLEAIEISCSVELSMKALGLLLGITPKDRFTQDEALMFHVFTVKSKTIKNHSQISVNT